jgi:hypothetical protein
MAAGSVHCIVDIAVDTAVALQCSLHSVWYGD